jgi:uncharacterized protein YutE (UPF0331/DUF86 family)
VDADEIVLERLAFLRNEVGFLKRERDRLHSFEEYKDDMRLKRAMERSLQVSVEACLDIGRRIIAMKSFRYPEDNRDVFQVLYEYGVAPAELLPALIDMARFRNLVVHDYARIDDAQVYAILKKKLTDFDAYVQATLAYLEQDVDRVE